jgi:ABC-type multidrug transport system ATPase subunit
VKDIFGHYEKKWILKDINLVLKPGKTYLVVGPPGCGKTSLLKAISGRLRSKASHCDGRIEYNGVSMEVRYELERICLLPCLRRSLKHSTAIHSVFSSFFVTKDATGIVLQNIVSYVDQLDTHAPFLTVQETFDFAANCRIGVGKQKKGCDSEEILSENLTIDGLDLAVCRNTFVGDANNRGVSGGQRRRVTLGEMMVGQNPVACADEISTGLDAAVTYDISR